MPTQNAPYAHPGCPAVLVCFKQAEAVGLNRKAATSMLSFESHAHARAHTHLSVQPTRMALILLAIAIPVDALSTSTCARQGFTRHRGVL